VPGLFETTVKAFSSSALMAFCMAARNASSIFSWTAREVRAAFKLQADRTYTHRRALNYDRGSYRYGYCVRWRWSGGHAGIGIFDI
jgi:hypothetical protein